MSLNFLKIFRTVMQRLFRLISRLVEARGLLVNVDIYDAYKSKASALITIELSGTSMISTVVFACLSLSVTEYFPDFCCNGTWGSALSISCNMVMSFTNLTLLPTRCRAESCSYHQLFCQNCLLQCRTRDQYRQVQAYVPFSVFSDLLLTALTLLPLCTL